MQKGALSTAQAEAKKVYIPLAVENVILATTKDGGDKDRAGSGDALDATAFGTMQTALVDGAKGTRFYTEFNNYFSFGVDAQVQHQVHGCGFWDRPKLISL